VFALVLTALMYLHGTAMSLHFDVPSLLGGALGIISTVMLALFIDSIIRQSEERQRLIQALEDAKAELTLAERQAGVLAERQRLAQEIHDTVAQGFVGIVTHLEAAETSLDDAAAVARHLTAAKGAARESLGEARRLVSGLRPDLLGGEPLSAVLQRQLGHWSSETGIATGQVITGTPRRIDTDREEALVQAAREGLNNVRTHAKAARVTLTLSYMEDEVVLDLEDDGAGSRAAPNPEGGFGLRALTERVRALGGRCELESREDGATLSVALPIEA
jgi:signal transduction histidine kinase